MTTPTPTPHDVDRVDAIVRGAAVALAAVAFAGSYVHVAGFAAAKGQPWPLALTVALMPEVSVALCILVLRRHPPRLRAIWAAVVLVTSVAFTVRANLGVVIPTDPAAILVAVWPAWAAIGAAGLTDLHPSKPATEPAKPASKPASKPATEPAKPATLEGLEPFPAGRGGVAEAVQAAWFVSALELHPGRSDAEWATITGLSERTVQRRIAAAGGRPRAEQGAEVLDFRAAR